MVDMHVEVREFVLLTHYMYVRMYTACWKWSQRSKRVQRIQRFEISGNCWDHTHSSQLFYHSHVIPSYLTRPYGIVGIDWIILAINCGHQYLFIVQLNRRLLPTAIRLRSDVNFLVVLPSFLDMSTKIARPSASTTSSATTFIHEAENGHDENPDTRVRATKIKVCAIILY